MNDAMLFAMLYFGSIALVVALTAVFVQAAFVALAARLGSHLLAAVPVLALGAGALGVALSKRDLQLNQLFGGGGEGAGALWITRLANLVLLAIALAKLTQMLFARRGGGSTVVPTEAQRANRRLFTAFLVYAFCSLILPMVFSTQPAFSHDGLIAVPMFAAAYLARGESMSGFLKAAKWTLLLIVVGSLAVAAVMPQLAVSKYLTGLIPGLPIRLWGLTSHPNNMGATAISLLLVLWLHPFEKGWLNTLAWISALVALVLTQSKTNWLAALILFGTLLVYKHGRDVRGGLRIGVWVFLLLGGALATTGLLFVDVGEVMNRFVASDAGSGLTTLTGRTRIWEVAVQMWLDSPLFGYGPEAWSPLHRTQLGVPFATQAHNQLMEALSVGGLAYAVPMTVYFVLLARGAARTAEQTRGVSIAFLLLIAIRCLSEAPFGIGNMTGGDTVLHLLLFMVVVSESPQSVMAASKKHVPAADGRTFDTTAEKGLIGG